MTRLDPAGEPSMEDILASIRKIIAEDPPGSRPEPKPQSLPPSERLVMRPSQPEPREPLIPEAAAEPQPVAPIAIASGPVTGQHSFPNLLSSRAMDMGRLSRPAAPETVAPRDPAPSVDDQLSALLGDAPAAPAAPVETPAAAFAEPAVESADDFLAKLSARAAAQTAVESAPARPAAAKPEGRPGFTVSRDGFVPGAKAPEAPVRDPFEFTLGPSPFANKPADESAAPQETQAQYAPKHDLGAFIPSRHPDPLPSAPARTSLFERAVPAAAPVPASAATATAEPAFAAPDVRAVLDQIEASAAKPLSVQDHVAQTAPVDRAVEPAMETPSPEAQQQPFADVPKPVTTPASSFADLAPPVATLPDLQPAAIVTEIETAASADEIAAVFEPADNAAPEPCAVHNHVAVDEQIAMSAAFVRTEEPQANASAFAASSFDSAKFTPAAEPPAGAAEPFVPSFSRAPSQPDAPDTYARDFGHEALKASPALTASLHDDHMMAGEPAERSMEDTVAELLRPMLRSWLAENMPRILERALRKEISDSKRIEHKPAAE